MRGHVHLLLAEALEAGQKEKHISLAPNYARIIEQTKLALAYGVAPSVDLYRRWGESLEALDRPREAMDVYQKAVALGKDVPPDVQRRVIELELTQGETSAAEVSIAKYLKSAKLSKIDRAWALIVKSRALIKRDEVADAIPLLEEALKLDEAPVSQGIARYWIGYCTWKQGKLEEAERILRVARDQLKISHPLDADAAYALGQVLQQKNTPKEAGSFYQSVITTHPESRIAPLAKLRRGLCRISMDEDEAALSDLHDVVKELTSKKNRESLTNEAVEGLRYGSKLLAAKKNYQGALEALIDEQTLTPDPPAEFFARLANVFEHRADQLESTIASAANAEEKAKLNDQVIKLRVQAGDAYAALSAGLTLADDRGQGDATWKAVESYDRAGATLQSIAAMEKFIADRPDDPTHARCIAAAGTGVPSYRSVRQGHQETSVQPVPASAKPGGDQVRSAAGASLHGQRS